MLFNKSETFGDAYPGAASGRGGGGESRGHELSDGGGGGEGVEWCERGEWRSEARDREGALARRRTESTIKWVGGWGLGVGEAAAGDAGNNDFIINYSGKFCLD